MKKTKTTKQEHKKNYILNQNDLNENNSKKKNY